MKKILKIGIVIGLLALFWIVFLEGVSINDVHSKKYEATRIKETIENTTVQYYAIYGIYPKSIEEIKEQYSLHINEVDYSIYYDYNGSNILPDIHVVRKE